MTETHTIDPTGRTLHIRLLGTGEDGTVESDILERLDAGEDIEPDSDPVLRVESLETLGRILRGTNLELLDAVATHEPESVRALARAVDRGPKEVLQNLNELEDYGLVAFEEQGRAKRPYLPYEEIDVQLPFPHSTSDDDSIVSSPA
jgi:predicted transcriptional regulator